MRTVSFRIARHACCSARRWALARALCALVVGLDAQAQQTLTLDQALRLAQQRSRQLVAQDAGAAAARQLAVVADQLPDPLFSPALITGSGS